MRSVFDKHDPLDDLEPPDMPRFVEWLLYIAAGKDRCDEIIGDLRRRLVDIDDPSERNRQCWRWLPALLASLLHCRVLSLYYLSRNPARHVDPSIPAPGVGQFGASLSLSGRLSITVINASATCLRLVDDDIALATSARLDASILRAMKRTGREDKCHRR